MKIAFISRWFVEENKRTGGRGGSEQQRVKGYIDAGHEVVVLSQEENSARLQAGTINGIAVVTTDRWRRVWWLALLDKLAKGWSQHRKVMSDAWELHLFLEKFGPFDVLEAQCEEPDGLVVAVCSLFRKMPPWCVQLFALRYSFVGSEPRFEQKGSLGFAFRRANLVKANSELVAECLEKEYGCAREKIVVVHPNIEMPDTSGEIPHLEGRSVLCVGALTKTKGIETFVQSAELLSKDRNKLHLLIAGGAGSDSAYAEELQKMEGGRGIKWLGALGRGELHGWMRAADVVVIPSWFDAWNRAAIEAVALGKPVVISDRCGAAEWIRKQGAGVVFRAGDAAGLAAAVGSVLQAKEYEVRARASGAAAVREFGTAEIARRNIEVFQALERSGRN